MNITDEQDTQILLPKPILSLPLAILVAGILVAGAIAWTNGSGNVASVGEPKEDNLVATSIPVMPISSADHYRGSPTAPVIVLEFSDTECPFCKNFHSTMRQLLADEPEKVAWVYRHAPILGLHKKAFTEAVATECAAELGGDDAFWDYLDMLFEITPANDGLDLDQLPEIAVSVDLDRDTFLECQSSGRHDERIEGNLNDALAAGPGSTPWSVVMTRDGSVMYPISGAMPLSVMKQVVNVALAKSVK
ncbi:MAG: hypothetical protein COV07_00035 [Candidatus Vogelbacteria bacterium CG10_big_fil_rev_8_21_14_0_10_45_14]|uniref:Thioredoxin domain-containing protein n=1 Tax=Candidatus Vogelbacteria bacterium CG10_big_fil_rev_8_21_14_0_10_45_14 TaxID=1975042 RepID=A0A2H0RL45_9BACT|nr:MAG: hypothetical protein COV07_00035 [Candidatus Vogelbacteria bacterium CG10_big_fil_rev_8_21_14_0_10_45_14]